MHDFCFTYPYGFLVLIGGLLGFLRKGSTTSLMGGVGSGLLLLLAGYQSHQAFLKGSKSPAALFLETGVSLCPLQNLLLPPLSIFVFLILFFRVPSCFLQVFLTACNREIIS
jgi:hypothetical protein